jgi:hypothetical protein
LKSVHQAADAAHGLLREVGDVPLIVLPLTRRGLMKRSDLVLVPLLIEAEVRIADRGDVLSVMSERAAGKLTLRKLDTRF